MSDLQDSVLYISNTVPQNGEQFHPSIQTRTTSLKLFTNLTNQMKYVTIQIEHPDEDKQENSTSGTDRTVNDVFKS